VEHGNYENIIRSLISCKNDNGRLQDIDKIIEMTRSFYGNDYDKLYGLIYELFKRKECKITNILLREIITERPYYINPDIYWMQLEVYDDAEGKNTEINKCFEEKDLLTNYLISHQMNVKDDEVGDHGETYIVCCKFDSGEYSGQDLWMAIGFLKRLIESDLKKKVYRYGGDSIPAFARGLADIYLDFEGEKSQNYQKYKRMSTLYQCLEEVHSNILQEYQKEEIEKALFFMIEETPDDSVVNYVLGRYFNKFIGDTDSAIKYLERAVHLNIDEWRAYFMLAKIYSNRGDFKTAEQLFLRAFEVYDENEIDRLIDGVKESLSSVGGGNIDYDQVKEHAEAKDIAEYAPSRGRSFQHILEIDESPAEIAKIAQKNLMDAYGKYYEKLHPHTLYHLKNGELVHIEHGGDTAYVSKYMEYYTALLSEIWQKVFVPFRKNFHGRYQKEYGKNMKSLKDKDTKFYRFMNDRSSTSTGGQMLGYLTNVELKHHPIYKSFLSHVEVTAPILRNQDYLEEIRELSVERNKDGHPEDYGKSKAYYNYVRGAVLGTPKREGLLIRLIKSLEGK